MSGKRGAPHPGNFAKVLHGSEEETYINIDCSINALARFLQALCGVDHSVPVDLCTERGIMIDLAAVLDETAPPSNDPAANFIRPRATYILMKKNPDTSGDGPNFLPMLNDFEKRYPGIELHTSKAAVCRFPGRRGSVKR
eukprot:m.301542 g.301542  ORF g.301542 m.301542 type:complete len:140 (+) comp14820_c0_seq1:95-514(+)